MEIPKPPVAFCNADAPTSDPFSPEGFRAAQTSKVTRDPVPRLKIVQERLGHTQTSRMLDIYSHVLWTMQVEAAGKLDCLLNRRRTSVGTPKHESTSCGSRTIDLHGQVRPTALTKLFDGSFLQDWEQAHCRR
jgi:hypothetical protein